MNATAMILTGILFLLALLAYMLLRWVVMRLTWPEVRDWFRRLNKADDEEASKQTMFNSPTTEHWPDEELAGARNAAIILAVVAVVLALMWA